MVQVLQKIPFKTKRTAAFLFEISNANLDKFPSRVRIERIFNWFTFFSPSSETRTCDLLVDLELFLLVALGKKMAEQIQKLTHDNQKFDAQWNDIQDNLRDQCAESKIPPTLDALAQYVLKEPRTSVPCDSKFDLINMVFNAMNYDSDDDKNNSVLNHVTDVFLRVFDQGQIDRWHLAFLKGLYRRFALNDYQLKKISFLDQLFLILPKKSFPSSPNNQSNIDAWQEFFCNEIFNYNLLDESMLPTMRGKFQQLCR